jgi:hypothetical protein
MRALAALTLAGIFWGGCTSSGTVTGVVRMTPEIEKGIGADAVLYVVAENGAGEPVAVRRFQKPLRFPMDFSLGGDDMLVPNAPLRGKLTLSARVAQSGSPLPAAPGDIESLPLADPVEAGATGVELELSRVRR